MAFKNKCCDNCYCLTELNSLLLMAYKSGTKVRLIGDKFIGEIRGVIIGLRNIRYSVIYPSHKFCINAQHSSLEIVNV